MRESSEETAKSAFPYDVEQPGWTSSRPGKS
jgi:hypothetical protein